MRRNSNFILKFKGAMTYDGVKTESNNGTRKNTRRYVIICNSDYVRVNGLYNDSRAKPRLRMVLGMPRK